ncbi:MAG: IreB family regulatory phosphoprotein [Firmicutes bacterium]|nr:IreB family regulatory phosphoprotein [Bacillota bacterium]
MSDYDTGGNPSIREVLELVYDALEEKGYNGIDQLGGFLLTGDPSYITVNRNARNILMKYYDRDEYVEELLLQYFKK